MYKIINGWFFTKAIFVEPDADKLESLGIPVEEHFDDFRFNIKEMSSYNRSEKGPTTVDVAGFRIVLSLPFEAFDEAFKDYLLIQMTHG